MPVPRISVNRSAWDLSKKLQNQAERLGVIVKKTESGATLIDAGIEAKGGLLAGKIITEICLGGCGKAKIFFKQYDDFELPSIFVYTDLPAIATLGSQFAGWQIKVGRYNAIASGPARAITLKPRKLYERIRYNDRSDVAVIVLEVSKKPPEEVIQHISDECEVASDHLSIILTPTSTITGSTQVSGRIVETGVHKLMELGFDPKQIAHACGYAPIAPVHPSSTQAMGRTNDAIMYAGVAYYTVNYDDDEGLRKLIEKAPSSASRSYGKPFAEIFKEADYDFYKIDPGLFAPAVLVVNNAKTGSTFKAGKIDIEVFKRSSRLQTLLK